MSQLTTDQQHALEIAALADRVDSLEDRVKALEMDAPPEPPQPPPVVPPHPEQASLAQVIQQHGLQKLTAPIVVGEGDTLEYRAFDADGITDPIIFTSGATLRSVHVLHASGAAFRGIGTPDRPLTGAALIHCGAWDGRNHDGNYRAQGVFLQHAGGCVIRRMHGSKVLWRPERNGIGESHLVYLSNVHDIDLADCFLCLDDGAIVKNTVTDIHQRSIGCVGRRLYGHTVHRIADWSVNGSDTNPSPPVQHDGHLYADLAGQDLGVDYRGLGRWDCWGVMARGVVEAEINGLRIGRSRPCADPQRHPVSIGRPGSSVTVRNLDQRGWNTPGGPDIFRHPVDDLDRIAREYGWCDDLTPTPS